MTTTADIRQEYLELTAERDALRAQLEGDLPAATRWLQRKVWRQAVELDRLNRYAAFLTPRVGKRVEFRYAK